MGRELAVVNRVTLTRILEEVCCRKSVRNSSLRQTLRGVRILRWIGRIWSGLVGKKKQPLLLIGSLVVGEGFPTKLKIFVACVALRLA